MPSFIKQKIASSSSILSNKHGTAFLYLNNPIIVTPRRKMLQYLHYLDL
jgi:hypothetical protein